MALPSTRRHGPDTDDQDDTRLVRRYIEPHPSESGRAYAYFPDFGHSVAAIIRSLKVDNGDISATAATWQMPEEAIRAAVAFYRTNRDFIDARLLLEDDAWSEWSDA